MKELVEKVLETEKQAAERVARAREEAAKVQSDADRESSVIIENARLEAAGIVEEAVRQAEAEGRRVQEERLASARSEAEQFRDGMKDRFGPIIRAAVGMVIQGKGD
jgi:V/A-type H+-transporting ATPase subunit G/H